MKLSRTAKIVLGVSAVLAVCLFLVIADLGINAGRIHYGVRIDHIDLGGLTEPEAVDVLDQRGLQMNDTPILFHKKGVKCRFLPFEVGWTAKVHHAVDDALAVGREGSLIHDAGERLRAWFGGVKIYWSDRLRPRTAATALDRCQSLVASAGLQVARYRLRQRIKRAVITWPRRRFHIPLVHS